MPSSGTSLSAVRPALQTPAELLAAGRPADAAEALAAVVADAPTYAAAYVLLGVALDAAGRPAEALTAWHRAAFLVPRSPLVLRERQRLIDATHAAADAPAPDVLDRDVLNDAPGPDDAVVVDEVAGPVDQHLTADATDGPTPADARQEDWLEPATFSDAEPESDADDLVIETAPLDDFVFLDTDSPGLSDDGADAFDPDAFDPDGFDFSAFDMDDEGESWLGTDAADAPSRSAPDAPESPDADVTTGFASGDSGLGDAPRDAFADWGDRSEPADVQILLPGEDTPAETTPPAADETWAVFEDLPTATPPAEHAPAAADMLTPDGAAAPPAAEDDWFVDAAFAAPTPIFYDPVTDESAEPDAFGLDDDEMGALEPGAFAADAPVTDEPIENEPLEADLLGTADPFGTAEPVVDEPVVDEPSAEAPKGEEAAPPSASVFAEPAAEPGAGSVADELDLLIASLETAPRIRPDPTFDGPAVRVPAADTGEMASETLARIYAAQHQYVQAALVYETLAAREPERAEALLGQAAEMRARRP